MRKRKEKLKNQQSIFSKVKTEAEDPNEKQKGQGKDRVNKRKVAAQKAKAGKATENPQVDNSKVKTEPEPALKAKPKKKLTPKSDIPEVEPTEAEKLEKKHKNDDTEWPKGYVQPQEDTYEKAVSDWFEQRNLQNWQGFMKELDKDEAGYLLGLIKGSIKEKRKEEQRQLDEELKQKEELEKEEQRKKDEELKCEKLEKEEQEKKPESTTSFGHFECQYQPCLQPDCPLKKAPMGASQKAMDLIKKNINVNW